MELGGESNKIHRSKYELVMPQGHDYIFSLQTKDFKFWKVVDGVVTVNAQPYFLEFSPAGWMDMVIKNVRNKRYWGIDRSISLPLSYVNDGAQILKYIFLNKGAEEPLYLSILEQQLEYTAGVGYGYWYRQRVRMEVDLTTYSHEGSSVKVTTLEDGLPKYLKANENTVYEFPMDVADAINIKMDGIKLHEKLNYSDGAGFDISLASFGTDFIGPAIFLNKEGESTGVVYDSEELIDVTGSSWADRTARLESIVHNANPYAITFTVPGKVEFRCTGMTSSPAYAFKCRFFKTNQPIGSQNDYQVISTSAMVVGQTYSASYNLSITLQPGERLLRENRFFGGSGSDAIIQFTDDSVFSVTFVSQYQTTYNKAFKAQYLFSRFIDKVTEGNYTAANADYFSIDSTSTARQVAFICGNSLRGFSDAIFKWSWSDFFQFFDSFDSVGISNTGTVIDMARKQDLIDTANAVILPEPSSLKLSLATDFCYNELEVGYPELKNDIGVLNGNEEFNTKYLYSMGVTKKPGRMDKVSKIAAGCYPIEKVRVTTVNKDTTDFKNDNDIFALCINTELIPASGDIPAHYTLDRSLNATATGLIEPDTVFNLPLSPHLNIKRNGPWLRSCLWLCDGKTLAYKSVDKNNKVTFTDPVYGPIVEKADENIGGLGDQFFVPLIFDITIPPPNDIVSLLDATPLQVYQFPFYGTDYTGILLDVSTGMASHKEQEWQLLALPDNEFWKLEKYFG